MRLFPLMAETGSIVDALLAGESEESALITYCNDIVLAKPFNTGNVQTILKNFPPAEGKRK